MLAYLLGKAIFVFTVTIANALKPLLLAYKNLIFSAVWLKKIFWEDKKYNFPLSPKGGGRRAKKHFYYIWRHL
ncbi:hypothetical protein Emin_0833 [Elusimicrobium minutum Pei191]|uniref:Uncharacterized protein n=1 Tax=Elusimicrobium minutum (strain Pei191) TaxID=445932 RepID=B2KCZ2_ELUMP|nr:hypothetical protein Emin_0833 [Elusimicrobium minutum Pei191]